MELTEQLWRLYLEGDETAIHPLFDALLGEGCTSFQSVDDIKNHFEYLFDPRIFFSVRSETQFLLVYGDGYGSEFYVYSHNHWEDDSIGEVSYIGYGEANGNGTGWGNGDDELAQYLCE